MIGDHDAELPPMAGCIAALLAPLCLLRGPRSTFNISFFPAPIRQGAWLDFLSLLSTATATTRLSAQHNVHYQKQLRQRDVCPSTRALERIGATAAWIPSSPKNGVLSTANEAINHTRNRIRRSTQKGTQRYQTIPGYYSDANTPIITIIRKYLRTF